MASAEFLKLVQQMDGLLLFVSAERIVEGVAITDAAFQAPELAAPESDGDREPEPEWHADKTEKQVQLVDLLQILGAPPHGKRPV